MTINVTTSFNERNSHAKLEVFDDESPISSFEFDSSSGIGLISSPSSSGGENEPNDWIVTEELYEWFHEIQKEFSFSVGEELVYKLSTEKTSTIVETELKVDGEIVLDISYDKGTNLITYAARDAYELNYVTFELIILALTTFKKAVISL